jgi:hypothetical protein
MKNYLTALKTLKPVDTGAIMSELSETPESPTRRAAYGPYLDSGVDDGSVTEL